MTPQVVTPLRATAPAAAADEFEITSSNNGVGLGVGARVIAPFDGYDQVLWGGTIVEETEYLGKGVEFHIVFDDGSGHHMWAHDVARALPSSIRLSVDRPGPEALELIESYKNPGGGRKRKAPELIDPQFLAGPCQKYTPRPPPKQQTMTVYELYAGSSELSGWFKSDGFETTTVDRDPACNVDVQKDILELPTNYCDGADVIAASPECRTYSLLACGKHRSLDQPEGFSPAALQANREVEHLFKILKSAKVANPETLFFIENPATGYMQYTVFARRLWKELGLTRVRITYCKFTFASEARVRKPTHIWTNSRLLIAAFENDMFYCTPTTPCGCQTHSTVSVHNGSGVCARDTAWFPPEFAAFVARMLSNEARSLAASA